MSYRIDVILLAAFAALTLAVLPPPSVAQTDSTAEAEAPPPKRPAMAPS